MDKKLKEIILKLYFEEGKKQKEIADILEISKYKVSRILNNDERYLTEKDKRKALSQQKHKKQTKSIVYQKRTSEQIEYEKVKLLHLQDSMELSENRGISNKAFRDWNSSIYRYNSRTKSYNLKRGINVTSDVPKRICWKGC